MRRDRSATHIKAAFRRVEAMKLRQEGLSYKEIGARLGCSQQRAHAMVTEEFARLRAEQNELAENILKLTHDRLEKLLTVQWAAAMKGDRTACEMALKITDRISRLFGVEAPPKKVQQTIEISQKDPDQLKAQARMMGLDTSDLENEDGKTESASDAGILPPGSQDRT